MPTVVCVLVHGDRSYYRAGAEAARSVLRWTPFRLLVVHGDEDVPPFVPSERVCLYALRDRVRSRHRAHRFLHKFQALDAVLATCAEERVLLLDADAVFVRPCSERMITDALGDHPIAMVEQPTVSGSSMGRAEFLAHYVRHTLALLAPGTAPPPVADFRYFNSGVVLATSVELARLTRWARNTIDGIAGEHQVGEHMVADQDYFQFWTNTLHPHRAAALPWYWNHCEHWHRSFPRLGALIAHFSNFCEGPAPRTPQRMRALQRGPWHWANRLRGTWIDARPRSA